MCFHAVDKGKHLKVLPRTALLMYLHTVGQIFKNEFNRIYFISLQFTFYFFLSFSAL